MRRKISYRNSTKKRKGLSDVYNGVYRCGSLHAHYPLHCIRMFVHWPYEPFIVLLRDRSLFVFIRSSVIPLSYTRECNWRKCTVCDVLMTQYTILPTAIGAHTISSPQCVSTWTYVLDRRPCIRTWQVMMHGIDHNNISW